MNYIDVYNQWLNEKSLSSEEIEQLKSLSENEKVECFYQNISFGTGGIRGLMGLGTNRVNIYTIKKATLGLAKYLIDNDLKDGVAISYDNRLNSRLFAFESAKVLAAMNIKTYVYNELRPTPMLSYAVMYFKASAGIMITASHNPKEYNGYKVYNNTGAQINTLEANLIIDRINSIESPFNIKTVDDPKLIHIIDKNVEESYLNKVKTLTINKIDSVSNLKIVYTPLHGNGGTVIPALLKEVGYQVYPLESQMIPDPLFSNTKSSNPEDSIAFEESIKYAKEVNADIILATDPDSDRLGVVVKHNNDYILLNGNQTASLTLYYLLSQKKHDKGYVYTTVVTTPLIKDIAKSFGMNVGETLTGFKFIGEQAHLIEGKAPYIFGCEESYGSLIKDFVRDKDAVQACYMLSEIASVMKENNLTLVDYMETIYGMYGYYQEFTKNISLSGKVGLEKISSIMDYFRNNDLKLNNFKVILKTDYINGHINEHDIILPPSNVLKFESSDSFIILRPSGTEPKLKVYFSTKKDTIALANQYISFLLTQIMDIIEQI